MTDLEGVRGRTSLPFLPKDKLSVKVKVIRGRKGN